MSLQETFRATQALYLSVTLAADIIYAEVDAMHPEPVSDDADAWNAWDDVHADALVAAGYERASLARHNAEDAMLEAGIAFAMSATDDPEEQALLSNLLDRALCRNGAAPSYRARVQLVEKFSALAV